MEKHLTSPFPPITSLFRDSWQLLLSRLLRFIYFGLIQFGIFCVSAFIFALLIGITLVTVVGVHFGTNINWPALIPALVLTGSIYLVIFLIFGIFVSSLHAAWMILTVSEAVETPFGAIFQKGFSYVLPLAGIVLLTAFFTIGGLFVLVFPAIIFAIFFVFSQYEAILDKQRGISALKRSYIIITTHFGDIFVRMFLLWIIIIFISLLLQAIIRPLGVAGTGLRGIFFIFQILITWYAVCYAYLIYIQAKERTNLKKTVSITWIWVVSIIGWVFIILFAAGLTIGATQLVKSGELQHMIQQASKSEVTPTPTLIQKETNISPLSKTDLSPTVQVPR